MLNSEDERVYCRTKFEVVGARHFAWRRIIHVMKLLFFPDHLEDAAQVPVLRSVLAELPIETGELRVIQPRRDEPLRLVMIAPGRPIAALSVPKASLYEGSQYRWREWLRQLVEGSPAEAYCRASSFS